MLGFDDNEFENRTAAIFALLHPDDESRVHQAVRQNWDERKPYSLEIRIRTKGGQYRWFWMRGEAVRDGAGNVTSMTGTLTDIHHRNSYSNG